LGEALQKQSCVLFKTAQKDDILVGRSIEAVAAAGVYGACRCQGRAITFDRIRPLSKVDISRVRTAHRVLNTELELPAQPESPQKYVASLASELDVSDEVRQRARQLAARAERENETVGVDPSAFAAGCLYAASCSTPGERELIQEEISETAGIVPGTLRSHWKQLKNDGLLERGD